MMAKSLFSSKNESICQQLTEMCTQDIGFLSRREPTVSFVSFFVPVLLPKSFWFKLDWSFLFPPSLPATLIQLNKNKNTFSIATKGLEPWTYSIGSNPLPTEPQPIGFTRKQQFRLFLILFVTDCSLAWPDLAKFRHFGTILGKFLRDYLVFGKILILLWQNYLTIGQVFIVVDGQIV